MGWRELALDYRREHSRGFGYRVFESPLLRWTVLTALMRLQRRGGDPAAVLDALGVWLDAHAPRPPMREHWASYAQSGPSPDSLAPSTPKQRFVHDVLARTRPATVLDCAANKGYYSEMAARLGASVASFDCEEFCVDACLTLAQERELDITPAIMDFRMPTPPSGWALAYGSAYQRFRADIVLALGLCHHLCIVQGVPVRLFCEICMAYARDGIVLEFVAPTDVHVSGWRRATPPEYSLEGFRRHFSSRFPHCRTSEPIREGGLDRTMAYFHR
jgi:hypothetical protein